MSEIDLVTSGPLLRLAIYAGIIILGTLLVRWLLFHFIPPLLASHSPLWAGILAKRRILHYLYLSVPGLLIAILVQFTPNLNVAVGKLVYKGAIIYSIVMLTMAIISALNAYNDYYDQHYEFAKQVPIKTAIQFAAVSVAILSGIIIIAFLLEVPLLAMAGVLAGIAAVIYYLFGDPLLGFSASLQLSANRMLGIGDWIEMDSHRADGVVQDINMTSTKVRNWDNAIVTIPTNQLIKKSFTNWRDMQHKDARQILRPIYLDQTSIAYASAEQKEALLTQISALYKALPEDAKQNAGMEGVTPEELRARKQLTNLELFMAYATQIIAGHTQTRTDYGIYVRQQAPTPQGLPVETFFFTRATEFVSYHAVQRDVFSNLLASLPQFELRPFQIMDRQRPADSTR